MSSHPSVAQRLGRVLERITRQSSRPSRNTDYGSLLRAGWARPGPTPGPDQTILTVFMVLANLDRHRVAVLLVVVVFPEPSAVQDVPVWVPAILAPAYAVSALLFGAWWIHVRTIAICAGRSRGALRPRPTSATPS